MSLFERFSKNPTAFLDSSFNGVDPVAISTDQFCLGNPPAARHVLAQGDDLYDEGVEGAGFFSDQRFGRRSQQLALRTQTRPVFRRYLDSPAGKAIAEAVAAHVPAVSDWPDAGNWFYVRFFRPVLLHDGSDPRLLPLVDEIIRTSSLAGARPGAFWRRRLLRLRRTWLVAGEIDSRKRSAPAVARDLLDVIISVAEPGQSVEELANILIAFALSISSTGFVLGWVLYLLATEGDPGPGIPSSWIVLETLRLWPTPWMLARFPKRDHEVAGKHIRKGQVVIACPYLVNRHADYWPDAAKFIPQRWSEPQSLKNPAFITFGHGPHRCAFADYATEVLSQTVDVFRTLGFSIEPKDVPRPLGPLFYPPAFTLKIAGRARE